MTTLRALLRQNPNYRYTWMAQVVSEIGDYFNNIAVFALVMEKSGSGLVVTGVMLSRAIPAVLAGPVAGVLLDRLDRRRIMIVSDLVRALIALAFVLTIHQPRPWLLYVLSAGLMFASPFFTAGRAAILPTIATPEELHAANSLTQTTQWATLTVGTLLAGYSAAWLGYHWAFVINSLSFVFSACAIWQIAVPGGFRVKREAAAPGHARLARVPRRPFVHAQRPADDGHGDDLGGLVDGRRRGADSVRAVRRPGLPPRGQRHRLHLGLRGHRPADRRCDRAHHRPVGEFRRLQTHGHALVPAARRGVHAVQPGGIRTPAALVFMMFSRVGMAVTSVLNNAQLLRHTPDKFRGRVFSTMESIRWSVMIVSMAAAGIASQYVGPRTIGLVAGAFGSLTAIVWAWLDWSGRLPEP